MTAQPQQTPPQAESDGPRIYVACLAAYNNDHLHGRCIDATQDAEDIQNEISEMLRESSIPHSEVWAIHHYEGFEGAELTEYSGIETVVVKFAGFVAERGNESNLSITVCHLPTGASNWNPIERTSFVQSDQSKSGNSTVTFPGYHVRVHSRHSDDNRAAS